MEAGMELVKAFNGELNSLLQSRPPVSKAKMVAVTKAGLRAGKLYKHVVQSVEKFIGKCRPEWRLPGLYVMDSILRQSRHENGPEREVFAPRFLQRLPATAEAILDCPAQERLRAVRVFNLWIQAGIFSAEQLRPVFQLAEARGLETDPIKVERKVKGPNADISQYTKTQSPKVQKKKAEEEESLRKEKADGSGDPAFLEQIQALTSSLITAQQSQKEPAEKPPSAVQGFLSKDFDYSDDDEDEGQTRREEDSGRAPQPQPQQLPPTMSQPQHQPQQQQQLPPQHPPNFPPGQPPLLAGQPQPPPPIRLPPNIPAAQINAAILQQLQGQLQGQMSRGPVPPRMPPPGSVPLPNPNGGSGNPGPGPPMMPGPGFPPGNFRQPPPNLPPHLLSGPPPNMALPPPPIGNAQHFPGPPPPPMRPPMSGPPPPPPGMEPPMQESKNNFPQQPPPPATQLPFAPAPTPPWSRRDRDRDRDRERDERERRRDPRHRRRDDEADRRRHRHSRSRSRDRSSRRKRSRSRSRSRERKKKKSSSKDGEEEESGRWSRSRRSLSDEEAERRRNGLPPATPAHVSLCSRTLWFGRIPNNSIEEDIQMVLEDFARAEKINIIASRGCAYVVMPDRKCAHKALSKQRDAAIRGQRIKMAWAQPTGLKGPELKEFWDAEDGVTRIPFQSLPPDLAPLLEGGFLDLQTLPEDLRSVWKEPMLAPPPPQSSAKALEDSAVVAPDSTSGDHPEAGEKGGAPFHLPPPGFPGSPAGFAPPPPGFVLPPGVPPPGMPPSGLPPHFRPNGPPFPPPPPGNWRGGPPHNPQGFHHPRPQGPVPYNGPVRPPPPPRPAIPPPLLAEREPVKEEMEREMEDLPDEMSTNEAASAAKEEEEDDDSFHDNDYPPPGEDSSV